ncbi:Imm44 family immunity protein [Roseivirga pacifica]|uniref:Imm44 family immunity protein n=1 Tax=Roseivirga pacifica TaxID=1267423 RepID=UPI003BAD01B9
MNFGITITGNLNQERCDLIVSLSDKLENYFADKSYGSSVKEFLIGVICVRPEFDFFFSPRKPRYIESVIERRSGMELKVYKSYSYEIKLDYQSFTNIPIAQFQIALFKEILDSFHHLDRLPKKIREFDKERLKADFIAFLEQHLNE